MKSAGVPHAKRIKLEVFEPHELCSHFLQPPTPPPPHFGHSVLPPLELLVEPAMLSPCWGFCIFSATNIADHLVLFHRSLSQKPLTPITYSKTHNLPTLSRFPCLFHSYDTASSYITYYFVLLLYAIPQPGGKILQSLVS